MWTGRRSAAWRIRVLTLIAGHPDIDIVYEEREGDRVFRLDTREIKNDLEDVPINTPAVLDGDQGYAERTD